MPLITETYYLSLTQDNRGILRLRCSQNDTLRTANLKLYNNGSTFTIPSGISAYVSGVKQNGAVFSKSCTISQDRKSVVLQLSSNITNVDGIIVAEIVLNDGNGDRLGTSNFIIQVEKNPILAGVIQDTETPIEYVNDFITQIQALTARVNNLITPNGDPSLAEVVDARISSLDNNTYQNLKARIDADIAVLNTRKANKSEVYTKAQVDTLLDNVEIDVDDELSDESENPVQNKVINREISEIKADLDAYDNAIREEIGDIGWDRITFTSDSFIDLSGSTADVAHMSSPGFGFSCAVVPCSVGDKFLLNLTGGGRSRAWGFVASNGNIISVADANATVSNYTLTAPTNAAYLVVHDSSNRKSYKKGETVAEIIESKGGLSDAAKRALMVCFDNVAWKQTDGSSYVNELKNALGLIVWDWDYEWYSSSGIAPSGMTGTFDFNTSDGSLKVTNPNLTLLHNSKFEFVVECAFPLNAQLNNPSIAIACFDGTNSFALRLRANPTSQNTSQLDKIWYEINYTSTKNFTNVVQTEYHRFRIINESTRLFLYIDDILINNWNWSTTTRVTSANNAKIIGGDTVMNIKSIKFRTIA